jgi:hypothetical protein
VPSAAAILAAAKPEAPAAGEPTAPSAPEAKPADGKTADAKPAARPESSAFASLAKKEGELFRQRADFKAQRERFEQERKTLEAKAQQAERWDKMLEAAKADPRAVLEATGLTYEQLTQAVLERGDVKAPAVEDAGAKALREVEAFKAEQAKAAEAAKKAEADRAEAERVATMEQFREDARSFVASNAEAFELTALRDAGNLVAEVVETHYRNTSTFKDGKLVRPGKMLALKEAAALVEAHFEEEAERMLKTRKIASRLAPKPAEPAPPAALAVRSLTNELGASTPSGRPAPQTNDERRARALAAWERIERK